MIFLILAVILLIFGIIFIIKDDFEAEISAICFTIGLFGSLVISLIGYFCYTDWVNTELKYKNINTFIDNKIVTIETMKKNYYQNLSIETANINLATDINNSINELEKYVKEYNEKILSWQVSYKYRLFNFCYIKPITDKLINLNDYQLFQSGKP